MKGNIRNFNDLRFNLQRSAFVEALEGVHGILQKAIPETPSQELVEIALGFRGLIAQIQNAQNQQDVNKVLSMPENLKAFTFAIMSAEECLGIKGTGDIRQRLDNIAQQGQTHKWISAIHHERITPTGARFNSKF